MIHALKVDCVDGMYLKETCVRILEVDEDVSLYDLHLAIQDVVAFDNDHLFEFFMANSASSFAKREWVTYLEEWNDKELVFQKTKFKDIKLAGHRRFYYIFDAGDQWIFEIRRDRKVKEKAPETGIRYPRVIKAIGPNPEQYPC